MKQFRYNQIEESRETDKLSLETFSFDKHNIVDYPIDKLIRDLKIDIEKLYSQHAEWLEMSENNPERFNELDEIAQRTGHSLNIQMYEYIEEAAYLRDELFALYEMKIIYAFKHLEINIKKLLSYSYDDKSVNRQFYWNDLKQFLSIKNIDVSKITGYLEVNQLREVNNSLKHSNESSHDSIKNYPEFKGKLRITYEVLEKFYVRIKDFPNVFLDTLARKIYEDLYEFDDAKIKAIAKSYALRMDENNAKKLADNLLKYYK